MKKKSSLLLTILIYIVCLAIGCVLGFTIHDKKLPAIVIPTLSISISFFVAVIGSGIYLSIVEQEDVVLEALFKGASIICVVVKTLYGLFYKVFNYTWSWLWILSIVFWFPVLGICMTLIILIVPFIVFITLVMGIALCFSLPFVIAFDETYDSSSVKNVLPMVLGIGITLGAFALNVMNITVKIPDYQNAVYRITYKLPDGAKLINDNNGDDKYKYWVSLGKNEENLCTAKKNGYTFEGWYYDEECTIEFESFGNYTKTGDIILYPKFVESSAIITYDFYSYAFTGKSNKITYQKENDYVEFDQEFALSDCQISDYVFLGWSTKHGYALDFANDNYELIERITPTIDQVNSSNELKLYGVYIKKPTKKITLNKQFVIGDYKKDSSSNKNVLCEYYVNGSEKTEYSLIVNHGSSYDKASWDNDYIEARIYYSDGRLVDKLYSFNGGGNIVVEPNKDFYIYFTSFDNSGKACSSAEYEQALALLVDQNVNVYSMIGAVNTESYSTIGSSTMSCYDYYSISDDFSSYSLSKQKITFTEEYTEIGFKIRDVFNANTNVKASISVFKDGVFIASESVSLSGLSKGTYVKVLDLDDYHNASYEYHFAISSDKSIYGDYIEYATVKK